MTETVENPYVVLGVSREATDDELRRAYERRLTDAAAAGALSTAQRIDAAYTVLRDPRRRALYDAHGRIVHVPRLAPDQRWSPPRAVPFRSWTPPENPRRLTSRTFGWRGVARFALCLCVVGGLVLGGWKLGWVQSQRTAQLLTGDVWRSPVSLTSGPPEHVALHRTRVLPPVRTSGATGPYAFEFPSANAPVRWDPCLPIRYVVSGNEPFSGAMALLTSAIGEVSADTGLQFLYAGTSTELPREHRDAYQPGRYGRRWAPALIAWTDPNVVSRLAGPVVGIGGGFKASTEGQPRLVSGIVALDGPQLAAIAQRPNGRIEARTVMLHELGHLVGLAHVNDPAEVMNPTTTTPPLAHYSAGDRHGLAILGSGPCPSAY